MPSLDITICSDGAKCKQRKTCLRFVGEKFHHEDHCYWWSDFYSIAKVSGRECKYYIEYKATETKTHTR